MTVANVTVPQQQISLVDVASFDGDEVSSGILGLGLRGLTSAYRGSNHEAVPYSPLVETMGASGAADPVVSFAMSRDESRSYIAFGGVPPVETGEYTAVPIQKVGLIRRAFLVSFFLYQWPIYVSTWIISDIPTRRPLVPHILT